MSYENESEAPNARLRAGLSLIPADQWNVKFVPQLNGIFLPSGRESTIFSNNTNSNSVQTNLRIHEGFGEFDNDHFRLRVGRQELNIAQGHLLGPDDASPLGRSFDALKFDYFKGLENFSFFYSIINSQSGALNLSLLRHEFLGLTYTIQDSFSDQFDFYILNNSNQGLFLPRSNEPNFSLLSVGLFSKKRWSQFTLSFDGVYQSDSTSDPKINEESQIDVEANYRFIDQPGLSAGFEFSRTSPEFNTLFQNSRGLIGLFDYFSPRNLQDLAFHLLKKTENKFTLGLDIHTFTVLKNDPNHLVVSPNGSEVFTGKPGENRLGEELDFSIGKKFRNLLLTGGVTFFNLGPYLDSQNHVDEKYHWIILTYNQ
jgi:hypothetical protein